MVSSRAVVVATLVLAACSGRDVPASSAESSARGLNAILPKDLGGGSIVDSASADGDVLVLELVNVLELPGPQGDEMTSKNLRTFACRNASYRTIVGNGIHVRLEPTGKSGRTLPPVMLDSCS